MFKWFRSAPRPLSRDPLDHPEIARMTLRELADLPMVPPMAPARASSRAPAPAPAAVPRSAPC
ncbi:hypothetical protein [Pseudooceanicola sp. 200-1SW]|uniref:hypothetical protein n=1 Tax=Pseudooceanicola sp. 200-1SW TaxID=3425949 RepID=UPI003D7F39BA